MDDEDDDDDDDEEEEEEEDDELGIKEGLNTGNIISLYQR